MKIIPAGSGTYEILASTPNAVKLLERCARTCYRSEGRITEDSADRLLRMIISRGHDSVLEHASATVLFKDHSRGFTHELVRHRLASFSQESTRYVKQDDLHMVIPPSLEEGSEVLVTSGIPDLPIRDGFIVEELVEHMQAVYGSMLAQGVKPEDARQFLPIGTTSDIVMTANFREWRHVFELRCGPRAHWEIRGTMLDLLEDFVQRWPVVFSDVLEELEVR